MCLKYCEQMLIDENQLSYYYNILHTQITTTKDYVSLIHNKKAFHFGILSHKENNKSIMKGNQASMCNLQP